MNMKAVAAGVVGIAAVLLASGFGVGYAVGNQANSNSVEQTSAAAATPASPPSSSSASAAPPQNARGAIDKQFGQRSGLGCAPSDNPCDIEFVLSAPIEPTGCSGQYPVENGRLIALPVVVETRTGAQMDPYSGMWNPNSLSAVTASGVTVSRIATTPTFGCDQSDETFPDRLAPASKYEGFVVLDIPKDTTSVMFLPHMSDGGWEWKL
ncbi:hypothetical protein JWS13_39245 [Rhodococcus pseudokoreensis]|uniref:DUF4352 domain-containing protein n=1 Tax=Rhodococcus pseudokoreensis TaxID=2811421 RepID=A0A974ZY25_9NOCA|nr:hypothetical protein [Rhodococcus pseudokoreensis]QSE94212.1 hypothetical protein JWS13_39245 [Rhodococcus pseudokoreensis]